MSASDSRSLEATAAAQAPHPLRQKRILVPLGALLLVVHLPFLHWALRCAAPVTAALPFRDSFDRIAIGDHWWSNGGAWRIVDGQLYSPGVGNNPLWLKARLPADARIEFDVRSDASDGDVKWEAFGDGRNHATGYVFIFGGWHNRETRIAKFDEHALTEAELRAELLGRVRPYPTHSSGLLALFEAMQRPLVAFGPRRDLARLDRGAYYGAGTPLAVKRTDLKVERGRSYHVAMTRRGKLLRWENDGQLVLELDDPAPLSGKGHDRFGFASWMNDTYFDNLRIEPL